MQALISCECTICPDCFRQHFTIALKEKHITDMVCPACGRPDLTDDTQLLSYFSTLDIQVLRLLWFRWTGLWTSFYPSTTSASCPQLRESLDPDAYALFHKKLTEGVLMRDPKFLWCAQVSSLAKGTDRRGRVWYPSGLEQLLFFCAHSVPLASYMNVNNWRQHVPSVTRPSVCAASARWVTLFLSEVLTKLLPGSVRLREYNGNKTVLLSKLKGLAGDLGR